MAYVHLFAKLVKLCTYTANNYLQGKFIVSLLYHSHIDKLDDIYCSYENLCGNREKVYMHIIFRRQPL